MEAIGCQKEGINRQVPQETEVRMQNEEVNRQGRQEGQEENHGQTQMNTDEGGSPNSSLCHRMALPASLQSQLGIAPSDGTCFHVAERNS